MMQIPIRVLLLFTVLLGSILAFPFSGNFLPPQRLSDYRDCKNGCGEQMTICDLRCNYHTGYLLGLSTLKCQRDCANMYWRCYLNCSYR